MYYLQYTLLYLYIMHPLTLWSACPAHPPGISASLRLRRPWLGPTHWPEWVGLHPGLQPTEDSLSVLRTQASPQGLDWEERGGTLTVCASFSLAPIALHGDWKNSIASLTHQWISKVYTNFTKLKKIELNSELWNSEIWTQFRIEEFILGISHARRAF